MNVIAVINSKGGVGKTAFAYNLAYQFAHRKKTTCLIDLDPSANATKGLLPDEYLQNPHTIEHFILSKAIDECVHSVTFNDKPINELGVIPSTIKLFLAQRGISQKHYRETILAKKINLLYSRSKFENYIIDCLPTLSDLMINAIYAANLILIPVTYEEDALDGMADLFNFISEIKENQKYKFKIIRNKKDGRKTKTNAYIEDKLSELLSKGHVLSTIIRQDESINQAKIERMPIALYNPSCNGAFDFNLLTEELLQCLKES